MMQRYPEDDPAEAFASDSAQLSASHATMGYPCHAGARCAASDALADLLMMQSMQPGRP